MFRPISSLTRIPAGRVQNLEHRLVAAALHIARARLLEKELDLFSGQDLRQLLFRLIDLDVLYGVFLDLVDLDRKYVQAFDRSQRAGDRGGGLAACLHAAHVAGHDRLICIQNVDAFGAEI